MKVFSNLAILSTVGIAVALPALTKDFDTPTRILDSPASITITLSPTTAVSPTATMSTIISTTIVARSPEESEPLLHWPDDEPEKVQTQADGTKICRHFSGTAGNVWGPCANDGDKPNTDIRHHLQPQFCGNKKCPPGHGWNHHGRPGHRRRSETS